MRRSIRPEGARVALLWAVLALLVLSLVAGCAKKPDEETPVPPGPKGPAKPATKAPSGEPIKIGLIADNTGSLAHYGHSHEVVAKAAVAKINAEGGIAGRPVELLVEDTESQPTTGRTPASQPPPTRATKSRTTADRIVGGRPRARESCAGA